MKKNFFPVWAPGACALGSIALALSSPAAVPRWQQGLETLTAALRPVQTSAPPAVAEPMRKGVTPDGVLRYVGCPPGLHLETPGRQRGQPVANALGFLQQHGRLFGVTSKAVGFRPHRLKQSGGRHFVHLQQTYAGVPVFASDLMVQLSAQDGVEAVLAQIERDTWPLEEGRLRVVPTLNQAAARERLEQDARSRAGDAPCTITSLELVIFAPSLFEVPGGLRLVWLALVDSPTKVELNEKILLDAHSGDVRLRLPRYYSMERRIYDARNGFIMEPLPLYNIPVRSEGDSPAAEAQVNLAYDYLGSVFNFYWATHDRSGADNDNLWMHAVVRYCGSAAESCPWTNALWSSPMHYFRFGDGQVTDDVVAHEYTHAVTQFESGLEYWNQSGAINESFSDIWGEFVDLTNGLGNDADTNRWFLGEDRTRWQWDPRMRYMRDPAAWGNMPDRLGSTQYVPPAVNPSVDNDWGGVHRNSSVGNKLCYLLTDGDTFNGQTVFGLGIERVAKLFYEVNVNLMGASSGWADLSHALHQAAVNQSWALAERENLYRALLAVEVEDSRHLYVDKWSECQFRDGNPTCIVDPLGVTGHGPYPTVNEGAWHCYWGDVLHIRTGTYPEAVSINRRIQLRSYDGETTIGR